VNSLKDEIVIHNIFPGNNAKLEAGQFYSIGLHPWRIEEESLKEVMTEISQAAEKDEIIAIGEAGLDKLTEAPFELQLNGFEAQIQLSETVKKPLIIHCVKSFNELIRLKKKHKPKLPWIIHGFNSKPEVAKMLLEQNILLSFGKALMYPLSNAAQVLSLVSEERFFLETDDSDFSIKEIYKAAAEIKKIEPDQLKSIVLQNFENCFGN